MTCDLRVELRNVVNMARCNSSAPPERNAAPGVDHLPQLIPLPPNPTLLFRVSQTCSCLGLNWRTWDHRPRFTYRCPRAVTLRVFIFLSQTPTKHVPHFVARSASIPVLNHCSRHRYLSASALLSVMHHLFCGKTPSTGMGSRPVSEQDPLPEWPFSSPHPLSPSCVTNFASIAPQSFTTCDIFKCT